MTEVKIKKIKFIKKTHPTDYAYGKVIPIKTKLMEEFEKKTGKRSITKYVNKPSRHIPVGIPVEGTIILSKGFLEWKKKRKQQPKKITSLERLMLLRKQRQKEHKFKTF